MFRKVTHLEYLAVKAFFGFVRVIRTNDWYSGIETSPAKYEGKPKDGDERIVTVWQGPKNSMHQRLEIHFFYWEEAGGWSINGLIFSGRTMDGKGSVTNWSHAFRGGPSIADEYVWRFVPVKFDGRYFKEFRLSEDEDRDEFDRVCREFLSRGRDD